MKLSLLALLFAALGVTVAIEQPESVLHKRVNPSDACDLGFATQNGGYVI